MTGTAAGPNSSPPPSRPLKVTIPSLSTWFAATQSSEVNSVPLLKPSAKGGSSKLPRAGSPLEAAFARQLRALKLPEPIREYKILPDRRYRWDFAWPDQKVAVEISGGRWVKSGHSSGTGIARDAEKANLAQLAGWITLTFVDDHLKDGSAIAWTKQALGL